MPAVFAQFAMRSIPKTGFAGASAANPLLRSLNFKQRASATFSAESPERVMVTARSPRAVLLISDHHHWCMIEDSCSLQCSFVYSAAHAARSTAALEAPACLFHALTTHHCGSCGTARQKKKMCTYRVQIRIHSVHNYCSNFMRNETVQFAWQRCIDVGRSA